MALPAKPRTVLVVEDDMRFRQGFAQAIRASHGLLVVGEAGTLEDGLRLLDRCLPDVLLVDLGLPDGNGIALIRHANLQLPRCEALVITVFGDDESILRCIEAGATGYILKDASDVDIVRQIELLLEGGSPISPSVARRLLAHIGVRGAAEAPSEQAPLLSAQEQAVLRLSAKGYNYEEISGLMALSRHTVGTYVKRIYRKLQVHGKTEAVYEARKLGLLRD